MSHGVSPNAYRLGRTQLWSNILAQSLGGVLFRTYYIYAIGLIESNKLPNTNFSNLYLLYYSAFLAYRYRSRFLYPRFYRHLKVLAWVSNIGFTLANVMLSNIWARASYRFANRFTIRKPKIDWRYQFRVNMLRGVGSRHWGGFIESPYYYSWFGSNMHRGDNPSRYIASRLLRIIHLVLNIVLLCSRKINFRKIFSSALLRLQVLKLVRLFLSSGLYRTLYKRVIKLLNAILYVTFGSNSVSLRKLEKEVSSIRDLNITKKKETESDQPVKAFKPQHIGNETIQYFAKTSSHKFSNAILSFTVSQELRQRVRVFAINVFKYMLIKGLLRPGEYLEHLSQLSSQRTKKARNIYNSYTDLINIIFLQIKFINTEWLVLRILKYALFKMHKKNLKLKYFLRFFHNVIMLSRKLDKNLTLFRLVVHGKIKGGTFRTKTETLGFGKASRNSIGVNIRYCYDNIYSKYGEYGMHLMIGRSNPKTIKE